MKVALGIKTIMRAHGTQYHCKHEVDALATLVRMEMDRCTLNWYGDKDVPEGMVEGANR